MRGEWNSLYSGLEPRKLLGHGKVIGLSLWAKGKARRGIIHGRLESWVIQEVEDRVGCHGQPILEEKESISLFGAWIINVRHPKDTSDHGKLLECARRNKIFNLHIKEGVLT